MHYYFSARCTRLPRWQDSCYRASRELCSNYLIVIVLSLVTARVSWALLFCVRQHRWRNSTTSDSAGRT